MAAASAKKFNSLVSAMQKSKAYMRDELTTGNSDDHTLYDRYVIVLAGLETKLTQKRKVAAAVAVARMRQTKLVAKIKKEEAKKRKDAAKAAKAAAKAKPVPVPAALPLMDAN